MIEAGKSAFLMEGLMGKLMGKSSINRGFNGKPSINDGLNKLPCLTPERKKSDQSGFYRHRSARLFATRPREGSSARAGPRGMNFIRSSPGNSTPYVDHNLDRQTDSCILADGAGMRWT